MNEEYGFQVLALYSSLACKYVRLLINFTHIQRVYLNIS